MILTSADYVIAVRFGMTYRELRAVARAAIRAYADRRGFIGSLRRRTAVTAAITSGNAYANRRGFLTAVSVRVLADAPMRGPNGRGVRSVSREVSM